MSPRVLGDHAHACTCVCVRMHVCVYVGGDPAGLQWGLRRVFTFRATVHGATRTGEAEGVAATWSLGLASWGVLGMRPPTGVRQGEHE